MLARWYSCEDFDPFEEFDPRVEFGLYEDLDPYEEFGPYEEFDLGFLFFIGGVLRHSPEDFQGTFWEPRFSS